MTTTRGPGQRANLDRTQVVDAACALVERDGAGALTMRALARELGVRPNALYSHVADKDALVDAVLDRTLAAVAPPPSGGEDPLGAVAALAALMALMGATYDVLVARPELLPRYLERQGARGPEAQRLGDEVRALLARLGVQGEAAQEALDALVVHAIGSAAFAVAAPLGRDTSARDRSRARQRRSFVRSLGWLLDGISADRDGPGSRRSGPG